MNHGYETEPLRIKLVQARNELSVLRTDTMHGGPDHEPEITSLRALIHRLQDEIGKGKV